MESRKFNQDDYTVKIVSDNQEINCVFLRANGILLSKFESKIDSCTDDLEKRQRLVELWKTEFDVDLIFLDDIPNRLKFKSYNHYLLLLLKLGFS